MMFATPGKDSETVKAFADYLSPHGGDPKTQVGNDHRFLPRLDH